MKLLKSLVLSIYLNLLFIFYKLFSKKIIIIRFDSDKQLTHLESVIDHLKQIKKYKIVILVKPQYTDIVKKIYPNFIVAPGYTAKGLIFFDIFIAISQGTSTPKFSFGKKVCSFYGQPAKGITYKYFNFKGFDILFFYGQLMEDFYFFEKKRNKNLLNYTIYRTGQPKTDNFIKLYKTINKSVFLEELGLDISKKTIIYAPSYEYCSSIETRGIEIIDALINTNLNIILKPHPAIYRNDAIHGSNWFDTLVKYQKNNKNVVFFKDLNIDRAILSSDIMLTDYSGVAFEAITIDLKMIYWDCPLFFEEYLPEQYGLNDENLKDIIFYNSGRTAGIVVETIEELKTAINLYLDGKDPKKKQRRDVAKKLQFHPGNATKMMVDAIIDIA